MMRARGPLGLTRWMTCQLLVSECHDLRLAAPRELPLSQDFASGQFMSRSRFDGPPPMAREEPPLPTEPPFTAFVVNLSFESTEDDVRMFFEPMSPISVRLVSGHDGRPRGYGYVEFSTLDELKDALTYAGRPLDGRNVRVSVAEAPRSGFRSAAADDASQWRRSTPLPSDNRRGPFGGTGAGISGFDEMSIADDGSRAGFGGKFVPSQDVQRRRGAMESTEPGAGDLASDWRTGKPVGGKPSRFGFSEGRGDRTGGFGRRADDDGFGNWRSRRGEAGDNAPTERRKLDLKPRSAAAESGASPSPSASSARSSPFGAAKPVDVNERQREIDEKIREQDRIRREQRAKEDERKKNKGFFKPGAAEAWRTKKSDADDAAQETAAGTAEKQA